MTSRILGVGLVGVCLGTLPLWRAGMLAVAAAPSPAASVADRACLRRPAMNIDRSHSFWNQRISMTPI